MATDKSRCVPIHTTKKLQNNYKCATLPAGFTLEARKSLRSPRQGTRAFDNINTKGADRDSFEKTNFYDLYRQSTFTEKSETRIYKTISHGEGDLLKHHHHHRCYCCYTM